MSKNTVSSCTMHHYVAESAFTLRFYLNKLVMNHFIAMCTSYTFRYNILYHNHIHHGQRIVQAPLKGFFYCTVCIPFMLTFECFIWSLNYLVVLLSTLISLTHSATPAVSILEFQCCWIVYMVFLLLNVFIRQISSPDIICSQKTMTHIL